MGIKNFKKIFSTNPNFEKKVADFLLKNNLTISTAESCTGGLLSSKLTDIPGSSAFIKENYVTYSNEAKMKLLNVNEKTLIEHGAVSPECATEMVNGLHARTQNDICIATTGIAGPGGATKDKNVGLMFVAVKNNDLTKVKRIELNPNIERTKMKKLFSEKALEFLLETLKETKPL